MCIVCGSQRTVTDDPAGLLGLNLEILPHHLPLFQDLMFTTVTVASQVMAGRMIAIKGTAVSAFMREK